MLESDGLGEAGAGFLMIRLVIIFLFLVKTRGQHLQKFVFVWKPTEVSLAEWSLSLSSLLVIPYRRVHQGQLEESGMVPRCWSWVLDHPVAANRVSRISQEKGIEDLEGIKCTDLVPLPRGLHIQDPFAAVVDLELF